MAGEKLCCPLSDPVRGYVQDFSHLLCDCRTTRSLSSLSPADAMNRKQKVFELCEKVQRDLKLAGLPRHGCATDGTEYSSILEMWSSELGYAPAVGLAVLVAFAPSHSSVMALYHFKPQHQISLKKGTMAPVCWLRRKLHKKNTAAVNYVASTLVVDQRDRVDHYYLHKVVYA